MTVTIVDLFETIEIDQQKGQRRAVTRCSRDFRRESRLEAARVVEAGQRIRLGTSCPGMGSPSNGSTAR